MAPKPDAKADKARAAAMAKKIEDKTFGMKNKNKSKQVQQQIAQMKQAAGMNKHESNGKMLQKYQDRQQSVSSPLLLICAPRHTAVDPGSLRSDR